jgi:hypothetical protein
MNTKRHERNTERQATDHTDQHGFGLVFFVSIRVF